MPSIELNSVQQENENAMKGKYALMGLLLMCSLSSQATDAVSVRFLLTFDDGPSTRAQNNPTTQILNTLKSNPVQPNIKAVFFTQTRIEHHKHGELTLGLLQKQVKQGHVLGIHTGTLKNHVKHTRLSTNELDDFLQQAKAVLRQITGKKTKFIRPTYWGFNEVTIQAYKKHDLLMLLTDISVKDGKSWGYRANPRRKGVINKSIKTVKKRIDAGVINAVDGIIPIVVTFHDTNTWTAAHMESYLLLLVDSVAPAGLMLDEKPFYDNSNQIEQAVIDRALLEKTPQIQIPWPWRWINKL